MLGRLVNLFGNTEFVHVALQIDSKHIIETDFRKRVAMNHIRQKSSMVLYFDMDEKEEKYLLTKYNNLAGLNYDNFGIASFISNLFKQNPNKYTCVELACELLETIGFKFENKNITPDELFENLSLCNGKAIRQRMKNNFITN